MKSRFHKDIYLKAAIDEAIEAYAGIADINLTDDKNYYYVEFTNASDEGIEIICMEFANRVLYNSVQSPENLSEE